MKSKTHQLNSLWICAILVCTLMSPKVYAGNKVSDNLLPEPQKIQIIQETSDIYPQNIIGFYLGKKAIIPFGQSYFPNKELSTSGKNTISLLLDKTIRHREGYKISICNDGIIIKAQTQAGLLYGVQTLTQLAQNANELQQPFPTLEIEDQPSADYRSIHIDLKHHLDKPDYMYRVLDRMAYYKLNAAIVEFEDKIKYESYPVIASPNAPTIEQWQKWSEYAYQLNIEISPLIQGIGHADYILKHDKFKTLREDSTSDWVCCPSNKEYYKVQFGIYDDAIRATPHGKYLHVGGDEVGELGICPICKTKHMTSLQHQLQWLKQVSDYILSKGRIPIFWDDMVFKHTGLIKVINDSEKPELMDSIWEANLPELNKHINLFPKKVIYMRWQYGNANQKGNIMALKWYNEHKLPVMGATAAQTTYAMMPLSNGNSNNIKSFQLAHQISPVIGVLCTAWDDSSALSDTYWKGFIAHAQYCWNITTPMDEKEFSERYRIREFGNTIAALPDFREVLESTFPLWETGLLDKGVRRGMWRTKGEYTIMSLPNNKKGAWTNQYSERLKEARKNIIEYMRLKQLLLDYRRMATRNDYSLQVFERINDFTGYTPQLLLAISAYDIERDTASLNNLKSCIENFNIIRKNMEDVYSQIRYLNQPEGYILPMNHHSHLAIRSLNSDWMFLFELDMIKQLKEYLRLDK